MKARKPEFRSWKLQETECGRRQRFEAQRKQEMKADLGEVPAETKKIPRRNPERFRFKGCLSYYLFKDWETALKMFALGGPRLNGGSIL